MEKLIIEIRAAEGGADSKLLVLDQLEIYKKACAIHALWLEPLDSREGFVSFMVSGDDCRRIFQNEAGGHRFQRIPPTEKKGRYQTSTITVAVMPVINEQTVSLNKDDIEFRYMRGSGNGGQHKNVTDSCVVARHLPTGIEARCDGRSQHQNKATVLEVLRSRIYEKQQASHDASTSKLRKEQVGSGMRGDKIRTIRYQDNKVKCELTGRTIELTKYLKGHIQFDR